MSDSVNKGGGLSPAAKVGIVLAVLVLAVAIVWIKQADRNGEPKTPGQAGGSAHTSTPLPRLVDLGRGKCIPCKMMEPVLEELREELSGKLQVDYIDLTRNPEAKAEYSVRTIPTQIFFDAKGKELFRHIGFFAKADILARWRELGYSFGVEPEPELDDLDEPLKIGDFDGK